MVKERRFLVLTALAMTAVVFSAQFYESIASAQVSDPVAARRAQLQAELVKLEEQIRAQQMLVEKKRGERVSLERDVAILDAQIEKARLAIRARDIEIEQLTDIISTKENIIDELDTKLEREKEALVQFIRKTHEIEELSLIELILSNQNLSDFFEELDDYESIKAALRNSFRMVEATKRDTVLEKQSLESKHFRETELRRLQTLEKQAVEQQEREKKRILTETRGEESRYQAMLAASERTAAEIRAELFALRDSSAIPFGLALELAQFAGSRTGVRPALILGVLTQETRLGENLGTGNYLDDMHPTRDRPLYLAITAGLNVEPRSMPVSKKPSYGWGGAMGPAQFIPSTWACYGGWINTRTNDCNNSARSIDWDSFWAGPWRYAAEQDRLRALLGKSTPSNPWENRDAFMASALLLKENGADKGTYAAERLAALRYFAGWGNATNPAYAFYGDGVMQHAANHQRNIDILMRP